MPSLDSARECDNTGMRTVQHVAIDGRSLTLSNLEKVLYPASGFTKAQVIDYYIREGKNGGSKGCQVGPWGLPLVFETALIYGARIAQKTSFTCTHMLWMPLLVKSRFKNRPSGAPRTWRSGTSTQTGGAEPPKARPHHLEFVQSGIHRVEPIDSGFVGHVVRRKPAIEWMRAMSAPAITAPEPSVTVPDTVPRLFCAWMTADNGRPVTKSETCVRIAPPAPASNNSIASTTLETQGGFHPAIRLPHGRASGRGR
jgi:hypothetical protein